ncbi:hypothetical protein [Spirosoma foliorum]|uniref:Uncharacterized protein n=1 Tax=Spirosoma foliorum TaxID=2710596 RepID=A0A7G5H2H3_9BACT|nr:hypothetical protein [Spirosoma foliorum]QMW05315.1 hypothetical protein H3H32_10720 [Spirosoma foliorum]
MPTETEKSLASAVVRLVAEKAALQTIMENMDQELLFGNGPGLPYPQIDYGEKRQRLFNMHDEAQDRKRRGTFGPFAKPKGMLKTNLY